MCHVNVREESAERRGQARAEKAGGPSKKNGTAVRNPFAGGAI